MGNKFLSPFSWRYGSEPMRALWSEEHKRRLWRRVWVALAETQHAAGLVSAEQVADLRAHAEDVDLPRSLEIEAETRHDLVAELRAFAEQCPVGGNALHLGATSMDIEDNAEALRLRAAFDLVRQGLHSLLLAFAAQIEKCAPIASIAFTHLQPAEPTTVGYRLAGYAQDLLADWEEIRRVCDSIRGKGFKGAVGTSASFTVLLEGTGMSAAEMERRAMAALGLEAFPVTTQIYPRAQDWRALNALAGLAGTLYKFAFDLRLLQSPWLGEWAEPFAEGQIGSSAMPFKRNPINAEKVDSLARYLAALPRVAWDNFAHSLLERTLDDSANRRTILPEAFLAADELIATATKLVAGLEVNEAAARSNLEKYGPFAGTERLLMALVRAGADRQTMHARLRRHSLAAWAEVRAGRENPLAGLLAADPQIAQCLPAESIISLLDASAYLGDAPERARTMAERVRDQVVESS